MHGDTVYLAGQVANKTAGQSVEAQTKEILETIDSLLAQAGSDKTKILSATIYLVDMATFPEMNKVWDTWVVAGHTPAPRPPAPPRGRPPAAPAVDAPGAPGSARPPPPPAR